MMKKSILPILVENAAYWYFYLSGLTMDMTSHRYMSSSKKNFWEYCSLSTNVIFVLLALSFAESVPAAGLGRRLTPKNGRKKWHLWYITSILLAISQMPLVLHFWGLATDGLTEEKIRVYKWVLAGARPSSCPWPDSVPNPVAKQDCYMNPAVPLWLTVTFM